MYKIKKKTKKQNLGCCKQFSSGYTWPPSKTIFISIWTTMHGKRSSYFGRRRHGILFPIGTGGGVSRPPGVCRNVIGRCRLVDSQWGGPAVGCKNAVAVAGNSSRQVVACSRGCDRNASCRIHHNMITDISQQTYYILDIILFIHSLFITPDGSTT